MNRDDVIRMAREAGVYSGANEMAFASSLERFFQAAYAAGAAASASVEREACDALHDHEDVQAPVGNSAWGEAYQEGWIAGAQAYREAIRARGQA